ncbi:golgin subfamily A member 6-like protein 10 [Lates japonicus]|uniref:Golgin subfamily A member 6-like protein 10 n=1 Tax=Lates japonicus TaxID=270547 RepID=A0AAD3RFD1_LATJO|nr:golgin subfamily A member 6-like protein 10 [Lates japonicus]
MVGCLHLALAEAEEASRPPPSRRQDSLSLAGLRPRPHRVNCAVHSSATLITLIQQRASSYLLTQICLKLKDEELKSVRNRSALNQKEKELKSLKDRLKREDDVKSSCQRCEGQEREHKESMTEMETFYKEKLHEARSALNQKEKELKSFKDRVAPDLAMSIKTGDTESMNNPVSKTKLTEMYNKLKLLQWPKIKDHLKSNAVSREFTRDLTQVKEFRQLTIHSLQMNLYHSRKEDLLQPDWENHVPGLDAWDIFPRDIKTPVELIVPQE